MERQMQESNLFHYSTDVTMSEIGYNDFSFWLDTAYGLSAFVLLVSV